MNLTLWIGTGLLAAVAFVGGMSKVFAPKEKLATMPGGEWTANATPAFVRGLGVLELLATLGLILPGVLHVAPVMVAVTALCWVALMIGAMITHGRLGQFGFVALNLAYLALAAFIVYGRLGPAHLAG